MPGSAVPVDVVSVERRRARAWLVVVVALVLTVTGCSGGAGPPNGAGPTDGDSPQQSRSSSSTATTSPATTSPAPGTGSAERSRRRRLLLATQAASNGLVYVDPTVTAGSAVVDRVVVGAAPWGVAVHAATMTGYVATAEGIAVVDLRARRRTRLVAYRNQPAGIEYGEYRPGGMGIAVSPDGSRVFVGVHRAEGTSVLEVLDTASGQIVDAIPVGLRPFDVLVSRDGSQVYTVDHDSFSVHIVDAHTLDANAVEIAPFGTEGGLGSWEKPHYAVLDETGDLLLPYQGLALARLDPDTRDVSISPMTANTHQHGVTVTPDGRLLVVGTGPFGNATGRPSLAVRAPGTGDARVVPLRRPHETVTTWRSPRGRLHAVLAGGYTREGAWDGATVIDLKTLRHREIAIPGRPQTIVALPGGT